jgi:sugar phosphate isomerase/epimerase
MRSAFSARPSPRQASRRDFLQVTGAAALAGRDAGPASARPRIGCLSACFHPFRAGVDPEPAIDIIGEMGFDGIELFVCAKEDIAGYWTDSTIDRLKKRLERHRLQVAQLGLFQPVVEGLTSSDRSERQRNLDAFEGGCRIGAKLGSPIINLVAPWARELRGPVDYLPRYYDIAEPKPGEKFHIDIARGFNWERLWKSYIETTKECVQRARQHRLRMTIENHTHTMIQTSDSFLRLWDAIRDPALGYNMDIGWTLSQREYPPVAIHKTKDHLMNVHARDIDGLMRKFVHVGEGVMDLKAVADALKAVEFRGFINLEQDKHPGDMAATCKRYLRMMREHLA